MKNYVIMKKSGEEFKMPLKTFGNIYFPMLSIL